MVKYSVEFCEKSATFGELRCASAAVLLVEEGDLGEFARVADFSEPGLLRGSRLPSCFPSGDDPADPSISQTLSQAVNVAIVAQRSKQGLDADHSDRVSVAGLCEGF